jgi:serine-type D-Ala-D-Ala carboxypeptidase/endopeptidase
LGLTIYRADGTRVFEHMYGDFSADQRVFIASASKMVTGVTLFGLIDRGVLSLNTTTGEVLGWSGDKSTINVRQLRHHRHGEPRSVATRYGSGAGTDVKAIDRGSVAAVVATARLAQVFGFMALLVLWKETRAC